MTRVLRALLSPFNVIAALLALLTYGASLWAQRPPATPAPPEVRQSLRDVNAELFFASPDMEGYFKQSRRLQVHDNLPQQLAQASLQAWVEGPQDAAGRGLAVVPAGSEVPQVWVRAAHYLVNLPKSYSSLNYGASGERMLLCSLTQTLLAVRGQDVQFLVDGQAASTLLGHMDLRSPYTRADCDL